MALVSLRRALLAAWLLLLGSAAPALAEVTLHFSVPGAHIGLNLGGYPTLQRIPGYPVYYAPQLDRNFFFYDGMYWVYENDNWYASSWYNGPWGLVDPFYVPDFILRVPVRYYRHAPVYFRGWRADAPPRWHDHWGRSWYERRRDWDRWDRHSAPPPAPLPIYQREWRGDRYPDFRRQAELHERHYRYQPRDEVARRHFEERRQHARQERREWRDDRRDDRREWREERRDDRRDFRQERREDRQERREDRHERREDRREDRQERRDDARRAEGRPPQRQEVPRQEAPRREAPRPAEGRGRAPDNDPQGQGKRPPDYSGG